MSEECRLEEDNRKNYVGKENPGFSLDIERKNRDIGGECNEKHVKVSNSKLHMNESPTKGSQNDITLRLLRFGIFQRQKRYSVYLKCVAALIGIGFMLIETELYMYSVIDKDSKTSIALKFVVTLSTLVLLIGVIFYHIFRYRIFKLKRHIHQNTSSFLVSAIMEFLACAIHPFPGNVIVTIAHDHTTNIDVFLSIAMVLRVYLIAQYMAERCEVFNTTAMKGFGFINKVNINTMFVFKTTMHSHPGKVLLSIMFGIIIVNAWAMQSCETYIYPDDEVSPFRNSLWLVVITFLTVGYGDITPHTYCGRFISVCTGFMGIGMTALLIAVLAQSLELTRAERNFQDFAKAQVRHRKHKSAAANVIKYSWIIWRRGSGKKGLQKRYLNLLGKEVQKMRHLKSKRNASLDNNTDLLCLKYLIMDIQKQQDDIKQVNMEMKRTIDMILEAK